MLKNRNNLTTKTIQKCAFNRIQQSQPKNTTHRKYLKLSSNVNINSTDNMIRIIKDLQRSVKQLRNHHESLNKIKNKKILKLKLKSSSSENYVNMNKTYKLKERNKQHINRFYKDSMTRNPIASYNNNNNHDNISNINNTITNTNNMKKKQCILSMLSKHQHMSTMFSIPNICDVDQVRKVYQLTYGKQNSNIIDLYNFYKKNIQKSNKISGSVDMSKSNYQYNNNNNNSTDNNFNHNHNSNNTYNNNQVSEEIHKSKFDFYNHMNIKRKQHDLNVIIEDRNQKDVNINTQRLHTNNKQIKHKNNINQDQEQINISKILKKSTIIKPSIEEIFKNGSSDLANVYDIVKNRRVSLKNYVRYGQNDKNKQNSCKNANLIKQYQNISNKISNIAKQNQLQISQYKYDKSNSIRQENSINQSKHKTQFPQFNDEQKQLDNYHTQQYFSSSKHNQSNKLNTISSKKQSNSKQNKMNKNNIISQKSSYKSSLMTSKKKQSQIFNLDDNISSISSNHQEKPQKQDKMFNFNENDNNNQNNFYDFIINHNKDKFSKQTEQTQQKQQVDLQILNRKFKKSKYYVQPIPVKSKKNKEYQDSLQGCEISLRASSRIIQLDFIQLDL